MRRSRGLPRYSSTSGRWTGGDTHTLYAFRDKRTGQLYVRPGGTSALRGLGPAATVRVATRAEAEEHWQSPLHSGWRTADGGYEIGSESPFYRWMLGRITGRSSISARLARGMEAAIQRAHKNKKINGEERDLLMAFVDARKG